MPNFNKVILIGHLTRDIELIETQSGVTIGKTAIAVSRRYKDKEETLFIDLVIFNKQAEVAEKYLSKGSPAMIEGSLQFDQWEDKNGGRRSKHKILVNNIVFLSAAKETAAKSENENIKTENETEEDDLPF